MQLLDVENLIRNGESETVEFKKSTGQRTTAAKTLCGMLNGTGGMVLFGVNDKGDIVGQDVSEKTLRQLAEESRRIDPFVSLPMETVELSPKKSVIVVHAEGPRDVYTYDGRPYLRLGPTTVVMPRSEYERRIVERVHSKRRWENEPVVAGVTIEDLDTDEIQITLDNAIRVGRLESTAKRDTVSILRGLELIRGGELLNAAVVLYGKSDQLRTLYPQMGIRLARFRGKDRLSDFTDNRQYWGHAFSLLRRAESFLLDHVPIAGRILPGKMVREDQPWYPPSATREALANAFCHRDYTIPGGAVAVAMYDDHLEITNPGEFHFGITPEKLTIQHESKPWNPIIANVFYRAGIIERWGMGTLNIIEWCTDNGNPPPVWSEQAGSVYVVFFPAVLPALEGETEQLAGETTPHVTPHVEKFLSAFMGEMSRSELMERLDLKDRMHFSREYLQPALHAGFIEMTIPEKPRSSRQKYRLTDKGEEILKKLSKDI